MVILHPTRTYISFPSFCGLLFFFDLSSGAPSAYAATAATAAAFAVGARSMYAISFTG